MPNEPTNHESVKRGLSKPLWRRATAVAVTGAVISGVALGAYFEGWTPSALAGTPDDAAAKAAPTISSRAPTAAMAPLSFRDLAKNVTPAVVNIATTVKGDAATKMSQEGDSSPFPDLPPGSPFEEFFKRFMIPGPGFGAPARPVVHALGSGFIISPDGYIVTNNHVVDGASDVSVTLPDHRKFDAKVIGADPKTDLALLKIRADAPLPYVSWGDSDQAQTGDWVMAVGNPFGLGGTVTVGIISARGRDLHEGPYDNFIQIDAPINRGNSGGPTFNLDGQVVGINSAIYSPNGGSVGIGFAIPANLAKSVIAQLREHGTVERGWIGVQVQAVTPEIADGLGLDSAKGALVVTLTPDSPAAKAGLKSGDVILKVGGNEIADMRVLPRVVADMRKGTETRFVVWRDGQEKTFMVAIGRMPAEEKVASAGNGSSSGEPTLGMSLSPLTASVRQQMGIPGDVSGVLVTGVRGDSAAAAAGIAPGDIIEKIGPSQVATPEELTSGVEKAMKQKRTSVLLMVNRSGQQRFVALPVKQA